jgi:hypothetical protein
MINISNKPSKQVEHFAGTITMSFPGVKNKDWNFTVLRTTNGITTFDVEIDEKQFNEHFDEHTREGAPFCIEILKETVKANLAKEQATWKPAEK